MLKCQIATSNESYQRKGDFMDGIIKAEGAGQPSDVSATKCTENRDKNKGYEVVLCQ